MFHYHLYIHLLNLFLCLSSEAVHEINSHIMKKILILTGGGDCPGLNAVIRAICKRAKKETDWEVYGSIEAFNGVFNEPQEIIKLTNKKIAGIHVKGGTILKTTNKSNRNKNPKRAMTCNK